MKAKTLKKRYVEVKRTRNVAVTSMFVLLQQRCLLNLPQGKRWLRWVNERWVWKAEAVDDLSKPPRPSTETRKQNERGWPETSSITSIYLGPLCLKPSSYLVLQYSIKSLITVDYAGALADVPQKLLKFLGWTLSVVAGFMAEFG